MFRIESPEKFSQEMLNRINNQISEGFTEGYYPHWRFVQEIPTADEMLKAIKDTRDVLLSSSHRLQNVHAILGKELHAEAVNLIRLIERIEYVYSPSVQPGEKTGEDRSGAY